MSTEVTELRRYIEEALGGAKCDHMDGGSLRAAFSLWAEMEALKETLRLMQAGLIRGRIDNKTGEVTLIACGPNTQKAS